MSCPDNSIEISQSSSVLVSDGETLIIDTGFLTARNVSRHFDGLDELQVDFAHTKLFLTHLHGDHSGLTEELTARGVPVFMNAIDYDYLCQELASGGWQAMEQIFQRSFSMEEIETEKGAIRQDLLTASPFPASKVSDNDLLTVGGITSSLYPYTGAHTGHTCLYRRQRNPFQGTIFFLISHRISLCMAKYFLLTGRLSGKPAENKGFEGFPIHFRDTENFTEIFMIASMP